MAQRFDAGTLTATTIGRLCPDTQEHHVELRDAHGGRLLLHSVRDLVAFEFDLGDDGTKDLFIVSHDYCSGFLRMFRIVRA